MYNLLEQFDKLPSLLRALIVSLVSFFLNITVLAILFLGTSYVLNRSHVDIYKSVLGVSTQEVVDTVKNIVK